MDKIIDLMTAAAAGAGLPDEIEIQNGGFKLKFLLSGRLLIPLIVMLANINHYRAFGKELIHVEGGIIPDGKLPFGCRVDGDLDLTLTDYSLGYISLQLTSAFAELKPYILEGHIDDISILLKNRIVKLAEGKQVITTLDYCNLPPLRQIKEI